MAKATYTFEVDWLGTGTFLGANDNCTADLLSVETNRGRDYASQLTGRASAGRLVATLKNTSGKYSSYYTLSPIYGNILPGRKVKLTATYGGDSEELWTGYLNTIIPSSTPNGFPAVTLDASGPFIKLNKKITPMVQSYTTIGAVIDYILTTCLGWAAGNKTIEAGISSIDYWFEDDINALNAIRDLEDTELGFFYEGEDGKLIFENRHHRMKGAHIVSQQTYSDAAGAALSYNGIEQQDPLQDIYNDIMATVTTYTHVGGNVVLWDMEEQPILAPGESKIFWATYPNTDYDLNTGAFVDAWVTPVVGTDITQTGVADGDIGVAASKFSNTMKITITNNNALSVATLTLIQARGTKATKDNPVRISAEDATSQGKYGIRSYTLPSKWLAVANEAQAYVNYIIGRYKNALPVIKMSFSANINNTAMSEAILRKISDRITVIATGTKTYLGMNKPFYVEAISHRITNAGSFHTVTFDLADASGDSGWWILGTSKLSETTKLAY